MSDTNPAESLDAEGIPDAEDLPPGITVETEQEGLVAPRDHPIAAGDDPAYPVTDAEGRVPEGIAERAEREIPDAGADELDVGGGVAGTEAGRKAAELDRVDSPDTREEAGEEIDGPAPPDDGVVWPVDSAGELIEDPSDRRLLAGGVEDDEAYPSAEESAVEIVDDEQL